MKIWPPSQYSAEYIRLPVQHIDSFSRVRTAEPGFRFDSQLTYQIDEDLWDTSTTGVGSSVAHDATERYATLTAAAAGSNQAVLQSHYHAPYTPGRGQLAFITFTFGATPSSGASRRVGYWDGSNGVYLEQTSSAVNLVVDTGTTAGDTTVAQASWNIDTMTGSGPSGKTLDLSKTNILVIQLQALYVGRVVVGFDIDGELWPVHQFLHANVEAYPYIQQASLPVRYEVNTTAASDATTLNAICSSVISEGGPDLIDMTGRQFSAGTGTTSVGVTTRRPVFSIRPAQQFNSINQNVLIIPTGVEMLTRTNDCYIELVRNGALTAGGGAAGWSAVDSSDSVAEKNTDADAISGGVVVGEFYNTAAAQVRTAADQGLLGKLLLAYSHLEGTADTLSVVITSRTGTSDNHVSIGWKEIR